MHPPQWQGCYSISTQFPVRIKKNLLSVDLQLSGEYQYGRLMLMSGIGKCFVFNVENAA
jgi:hypothetical protein